MCAKLTTASGRLASKLGLAAHPKQDPACIARAYRAGINYFFFYGPGNRPFTSALVALGDKAREEIIIASGSGARTAAGLTTARRKIVAALGGTNLDLFFAEYVMPQENQDALFADGGVFDVLAQWKAEGTIRYVGATTHDRQIARRLVEDGRVDALMHRFNMAHRKAAAEVFPAARKRQVPIVAFTATRWGTLLRPPVEWSGRPPTAADCYRYCLAQPAVQVVLTAPQSLLELEENLKAVTSKPMSPRRCAYWEHFGDLVRGPGADRFETRWP